MKIMLEYDFMSNMSKIITGMEYVAQMLSLC